MIASSTSSTLTGLLAELEQARRELVATQSSLGVRAGCQLFERFVRDSGAGEDFGAHKRHLVAQGRSFCRHEARSCQDKIAESTIQFLSDDCVVSRDEEPILAAGRLYLTSPSLVPPADSHTFILSSRRQSAHDGA